jgi:hypothetical protein
MWRGPFAQGTPDGRCAHAQDVRGTPEAGGVSIRTEQCRIAEALADCNSVEHCMTSSSRSIVQQFRWATAIEPDYPELDGRPRDANTRRDFVSGHTGECQQHDATAADDALGRR